MTASDFKIAVVLFCPPAVQLLSLAGATPKIYHAGTTRSRSPAETVEATRPFWREAGLTRVANITGLDHVGISTMVAIRPNARSLSVSQGKGIDLDSARASAVMESLELFHAEQHPTNLRLSTLFDLTKQEPTIDLARLHRGFRPQDPQHRMLWMLGRDLGSQQSLWVPYSLVSMDLTLPLLQGSDVYPPSSNGLASGNNVAEALLHALCELIERDAYTRFFHQSKDQQWQRRVRIDTIDDEDCLTLLDKLAAAELLVEIWDITSDLQIPTYLCAILESDRCAFRSVGIARGSGSHLDPAIALSRALTEAAQSRLTRISGGRDSMQPESLQELQRESIREQHLKLFHPTPGQTPFGTNQVCQNDFFEQDIHYVIERLNACGLTQIVALDLSRPGWPISVVRAVIPGLERLIDEPGYRPGARAIADQTKQADPSPIP